ncbi:MAG: 50S ribosomal protein L25/general stress protein Ctc [Rhodospirillaceae bacterium]|nr:50S ribosomal protein L25/general stress protein Ctc [Rhodospirillaceae bacterium]|tara:strand:- start:2093 stop:2758 length:666 start_codon:yes stop_codon:yes gene_type:complete
MADITVLTAKARAKVGKGSAREARRNGSIPAVIYGDQKTPNSIVIEQKLLVRHLNTGGFFNTLFNIDVDGELNRVLPRDVQLHPVTDMPEHVDFLRVSSSTKISVEVPVEFTGEDASPGLRVGGVLNVVRYTVEVSCTPDLIPSNLVIDLSNSEVGDSLHISAVNLPEGVTATISDRDFTIATIVAPTVVREEATSDADGDDPDTEVASAAEDTEESSENN